MTRVSFRRFRDCSPGNKNLVDCQKACEANDKCMAYDIEPGTIHGVRAIEKTHCPLMSGPFLKSYGQVWMCCWPKS